MVPFARLFLRFIAIGFGFFAANLVGAIAYIFLARLVRPEDFGAVNDLELAVTLVFGTIGIAGLMARAALLPALASIMLFEFLRLRDWLSHAIAGALIGFALSIIRMAGGESIDTATMGEVTIHTLCGIFAALAYWLVTGRNAGKWLGKVRRAAIAESRSSKTAERNGD